MSVEHSTQAGPIAAICEAIAAARVRGCTCPHRNTPVTAHPSGWHITLSHQAGCPAAEPA